MHKCVCVCVYTYVVNNRFMRNKKLAFLKVKMLIEYLS